MVMKRLEPFELTDPQHILALIGGWFKTVPLQKLVVAIYLNSPNYIYVCIHIGYVSAITETHYWYVTGYKAHCKKLPHLYTGMWFDLAREIDTMQ